MIRLSGIFEFYFYNSIFVGIAVAFIMLCSFIWKNKFTLHWRLGIWKILIAASIIPAGLALDIASGILPVKQFAGGHFSETLPDITFYVMRTPFSESYGASGFSSDILAAAGAVWLASAAVLVCIYLINYIIFIYKLKKDGDLLNDRFISDTIRSAGLILSKPVTVYRNRKCRMPFLVGFLKPVIVLPETDYNQEELKLIFTHELTHFIRKDLILRSMGFLAAAINWYNPAFYIMNHYLRKDIEICCDEDITGNKTGGFKYEYCSVLLKEAGRTPVDNSVSSMVCFSSAKSELKERFENILKKNIRKNKYGKIMTGFICVMIFAAACVSVYALSFDEHDIYSILNSKEYGEMLEAAIYQKNLTLEQNLAAASSKDNPVQYLSEDIIAACTDENGEIDKDKIDRELMKLNEQNYDNEDFDEKQKELTYSVNGGSSCAPHVLANGETGIYSKRDGSGWNLKKGDVVTLHIVSDKEYYSSTGKINYGCVNDDGIRMEEQTNHVAENEELLKITVPYDGEYRFFIMCAAGEPIIIKWLSVEVN